MLDFFYYAVSICTSKREWYIYVIISELSVGNDVVGSDGEPVDPVS
jgi:hypothetical protein